MLCLSRRRLWRASQFLCLHAISRADTILLATRLLSTSQASSTLTTTFSRDSRLVAIGTTPNIWCIFLSPSVYRSRPFPTAHFTSRSTVAQLLFLEITVTSSTFHWLTTKNLPTPDRCSCCSLKKRIPRRTCPSPSETCIVQRDACKGRTPRGNPASGFCVKTI